MRVPATVFASADALGDAAAREIISGVEAATRAGRPFVLGCPGGRSPMSTYRALAAQVRQGGVDLAGVVIAMMDDYVERDGRGGFRHISDSLAHSCRRFGREEIVGLLSAAAGPGRGIPADNLWLPDPADPVGYDRRLADAGGIDLFLLASGASDGHVAFNPPGTARGTVTRVVELAESTRRDNMVTFPTLDRLERVPDHGITVGIDTIARHCRSALLIAVGADKRRAVSRITGADSYVSDWPATVLTECANPRLYVDGAAAAALDPVEFARSR